MKFILDLQPIIFKFINFIFGNHVKRINNFTFCTIDVSFIFSTEILMIMRMKIEKFYKNIVYELIAKLDSV